MSREIKFRAWDKKNKIMFPVTTLHFDDTNFQALTIQEHNHYSHHEFFRLDDDQVVLMQFVGLHDRNGKEIYEGDVWSEGKSTAVVVYKEDRFILDWITNRDCLNEILRNHIEYGEVIDNIYENPYFLEVQPK